MLKRIADIVQGKAKPKHKRSGRWRTVRAEHLRQNPRCICCGGTKSVEVHHLQPFHERPDLELVASNLVTLCEAKKYGINCHQLIGHLGNYRRKNPNCRQDAADWNAKLKPQPKPKPPARKEPQQHGNHHQSNHHHQSGSGSWSLRDGLRSRPDVSATDRDGNQTRRPRRAD